MLTDYYRKSSRFMEFKRVVSSYLGMQIKKEALSFFFAGICVVLIPSYTGFVPPFMIMWAISRLIEIQKNHTRINFHFSDDKSRLIGLFILFFFFQFTGLFYSSNFSNGLNIVFSRLSLLLFPLLFISPGKMIINKSGLLLKAFSISTTLYLIFCLIFASYRSISFDAGHFIINNPPEYYWMSYFFGFFFSVNQHPSYVALFVIISLIVILDSILDQKTIRKKKILWIISACILLVSLYLLSSRAGFLMALISIPYYLFVKMRFKRKAQYIVSIIFILIIGGFFIIKTNERVSLTLSKFSDVDWREKFNEDSRILIWKSSMKIIKDNLITGVGIGDVRDELMKEYSKIGNEDLISSRYNAHNQFLEILLEGGIISFSVFFSILGYMIFISISKRNVFLLLFLINVIIFFMFETVLYRLAGVSFFSFFSFLLLYYKPSVTMNNDF